MLLPIAYPIQTPRRYFTDKNGNPLIGGKVKTFKAGSESEFAQTYRDAYRNASNQKIVKLDNAGSAFIYLFNAQRLEIYDKRDNLIERKFLPKTEYYTLFYDRYGKPLAHGQVYTYDIASTIKKPSYQDAEQTIPNSNPILLDESGGAIICIAGAYRLRSYDTKNVFVTDQDCKQENRFVLTSKTYPLYFEDSISSNATQTDAMQKTVIHDDELTEQISTQFAMSSATIHESTLSCKIDAEKVTTQFAMLSAARFQPLKNISVDTEKVTTQFAMTGATQKAVLITTTAPIEQISTAFAMTGATITS